MATRRVSLGRLQPGDEVFEKRGRNVTRLGIVRAVVKNVSRRSVTVSFTDGTGFSQNWAAHLLVKRPDA